MRELWNKWNSISLIMRILVGMVIGAFLGVLTNMAIMPQVDAITLLGTLFTSALKAVAPILVFFLVIGALANAKADKSMKTVIILYVVSTLVAALVAVVASFMFPTTLTLSGVEAADKAAPSGIGEVLTKLCTDIVSNPVDALLNGTYISILVWAILLGIALRAAKDSTRRVFSDVADAVAQVVRWVISLAPIGILGLVYDSVGTNGLEIFTEYGHLLLVLVGCMLFIAFVTNPLLVFANIRQNPYPLVLTCLKDSGITAFFTRSSAANIPVNMELCRKLGLNKDTYSVSIPLGATINMAGAAVTISVMAMSAATTMGVSIDLPTAFILCVLSAVSACGASGVPGGSLMLIPLACSLFGIDNNIAMQMIGVGFIIAVVQDSCETGLNSSSDVLFTATAEYREWKKIGKPIVIPKHAIGATTDADLTEAMEDGPATRKSKRAARTAAKAAERDSSQQ